MSSLQTQRKNKNSESLMCHVAVELLHVVVGAVAEFLEPLHELQLYS